VALPSKPFALGEVRQKAGAAQRRGRRADPAGGLLRLVFDPRAWRWRFCICT